MTTLHPDLLRACAAYLAHADAYSISISYPELLMADAELAYPAVSHGGRQDRIRKYVHAIEDHAGPCSCREWPERTAVARAILDATPAMLAWWCERLAR